MTSSIPKLRAAVAAAAILAPALLLAQGAPPAAPGAPGKAGATARSAAAAPDADTLYAIGAALSGNLRQLRLTPAELDVVKQGLTDGANGRKLRADPAALQDRMRAFADARLAQTAKANAEAGKAFVAKAAAEPGVQKTASGVLFRATKEGTGAAPAPKQLVKLALEGKLTDGTVFDTTAKTGPVEFPVESFFPCLGEPLQKMKVGAKAHVVCPPETAYGDTGQAPAIPPGATLVFDVELLGVRDAPPPAQSPHGGGMPAGHGGAAGTPAGH